MVLLSGVRCVSVYDNLVRQSLQTAALFVLPMEKYDGFFMHAEFIPFPRYGLEKTKVLPMKR